MARRVFSTPVEVFLSCIRSAAMSSSLLHARGGVSPALSTKKPPAESSPRPWRCFSARRRTVPAARVFSTPVEVFLYGATRPFLKRSLLHARGGVSARHAVPAQNHLSSPRPWRCFFTFFLNPACLPVFSTPVEVFLYHSYNDHWRLRLLHARGGVSRL